ncbi:MAG: hypothetical protein JNK77_15735 [Saprospiraceae bacterium]|nr:hypothetical protein [Saprospiraceae bacterium]
MSEFQQVVKEGTDKVKKISKRVLLLIILAGILGGAGYLWVCNWTYSEGTRAGYLVKISRKGVVFKTYEGQLNLGGFQVPGQNPTLGSIWDFSVLKSDAYQSLQEFEGEHVKLYYKEKYKNMPWQGDTKYFVYRVEAVR